MLNVDRNNDYHHRLTADRSLKVKTEEIDKSNNASFGPNGNGLSSLSKDLAAANKELAITNNELILANEQLKTRQNILTDFITIAAHELRTPVQTIVGYSELLQLLFEEYNNNGNTNGNKHNQMKKALDAIFRNANNLDRLIKDILDVARIDSDRLRLVKQQINLSEMIRNVISDTLNQIRNNNGTNYVYNNSSSTNTNVKITFEPKEASDVFIEADEVRIYQVISNLLRNAVKFIRDGDNDSIIITTEKKEDHEKGPSVVVTVKDRGTGIDPEILPRLFTKFATKSGAAGGIGLGLFISKSIVEAHGGRIWAENNNRNVEKQGATFAFSLPLSK
jgi:signal transduction histidine kinase